MKKTIVIGMLLLVLTLVFTGCTSPPPETVVPLPVEQQVPLTEQQILEEYPDNLDQALEELEIVDD